MSPKDTAAYPERFEASACTDCLEDVASGDWPTLQVEPHGLTIYVEADIAVPNLYIVCQRHCQLLAHIPLNVLRKDADRVRELLTVYGFGDTAQPT